MYHVRHREDDVGEFYDDEWAKTLWKSGITPIKFVTYQGSPMVAPYCRDRLDAAWREGILTLGAIGWGR